MAFERERPSSSLEDAPLSGCAHDNETHISALEDPPRADAWLPRPDEDRGRPQGALRAPREGPRAPVGLTAAPPARYPTGSRPYRLTGTGAFEAVFRDGTRFEGRQVQIIAMPAARSPGRFGLVVGRKALPRAIDRNRFKRLVREALRARRDESSCFDIVVRLKGPLRRTAVDDAAREAVAVMRRAFATLQQRPVREA
jgi:ribonuclease P protein component